MERGGEPQARPGPMLMLDGAGCGDDKDQRAAALGVGL